MSNSKKTASNTQSEQQPTYQGQPIYQQPMYQGQPVYQQPMHQGQPVYQQPQKKKGKVLGIISLILGAIAFVLSVVIGIINAANVGISVFIAIPCIVISIIGIAKKSGRWLAITGLILSVLAIVIALLFSLIYVS